MPSLITSPAIVNSVDLLSRAIDTALTGLSENSRRVYRARVSAWVAWSGPSPTLDRASVKAYLRSLEISGASPRVRNSVLSALKRLAYESCECGWIDRTSAAQIAAVKIAKVSGVRTGRWLTASEARDLMLRPDRTTLTGRRDAAVLALLLGCGLRRAELCALTTDQVQRRGDRLMIVNLIGKGGRVRSLMIPSWAQPDIERWIEDLRISAQ